MRLLAGLCFALLLLSGCGAGGVTRPAPGSGPEPTTGAPVEGSGGPAEPADTGDTGTGGTDTGDTGTGGTGTGDTDTGGTDTGGTDTGGTDTGGTDTGGTNTGDTGTDPTDPGGTGSGETGTGDTTTDPTDPTAPDGGTTAPSTPTPEAIRTALDAVIESADTEIFSFGGAVATCQALSCAQAERIYVRSGRPSAAPDTAGFVFTEARAGVSLAKKEGESRNNLGTTSYRSLAGWMEHGLFLVTVREMSAHGSTFVDHAVLSIGDSTGTNPVPPAVGSATWSGAMAGVVESAASGANVSFVDGDARITLPRVAADPAAATVDVRFGNVVDRETGASLGDMAWDGVPLKEGAFGSPKVIAPILASDTDITGKAIGTGIYGRFHGPGHEEVGGVFRRDGITGVFGATRDE